MKKWSTKDIAKIFDQQAGEFAAYAPKSFFWRYIDMPALDTHVREHVQKGSRVLDVGCGAGRVAEYAIKRGVDPRNIYGIDISTKLLAIAENNIPAATFEIADVADLHIASKNFDVVIAHMVFELLDDDALSRALEGLYERMAEGGVLFYINKHPRMLERGSGDTAMRFWTTVSPWGKEVPNYHRLVSDYENLTTQAGFVIDEIAELPIPEEAKTDEQYEKFKSTGPVRLVVRAHK